MWLGSVFKMRMSILNAATTEQMGRGYGFFFVYKSTGQDCYVKLLKYIYIYNIINIKI
ncbi:MAG: hypothetical protein ACLVIY_01180 [Anaerobutyricum soehngenii]